MGKNIICSTEIIHLWQHVDLDCSGSLIKWDAYIANWNPFYVATSSGCLKQLYIHFQCVDCWEWLVVLKQFYYQSQQLCNQDDYDCEVGPQQPISTACFFDEDWLTCMISIAAFVTEILTSLFAIFNLKLLHQLITSLLSIFWDWNSYSNVWTHPLHCSSRQSRVLQVDCTSRSLFSLQNITIPSTRHWWLQAKRFYSWEELKRSNIELLNARRFEHSSNFSIYDCVALVKSSGKIRLEHCVTAFKTAN